MKKILNDVDNIVDEMLIGMVDAHGNLLDRVDGKNIIVRRNKKTDKVALISGGGSGHEPSHAGYVGEGMLDAAVCGQIFSSPGADEIYDAIKAVATDAGVLLIIKNYSGDVMNFEMAAELAAADGIKVDKIIVNDDIAVEGSTYTVGRRGIAGTVFVHKIVGAAAEKGYSLEELRKLGEKVIENVKTMGMSLEPCFVPTTGRKSFDIADDEVEIGLGIHGEPGTHREKIKSAEIHVKQLLYEIFKHSTAKTEDEVAVMVNGLGATTLIELYIANKAVKEFLDGRGINIYKTLVGNFMTSIDMEGFSLSILKLDEEMKELLDARSNTVAMKNI
ncbi:dihydroxyacetone kinase subunit DhaK [Fusobacterium sp. MFO224]|uniref:dihydroxyacetone kinase subunit DhaK n=1 Tax=Fusobacterium sp. MFO224 TaxID=3378070 RepID=UPI00385275D1